MIPSCLYETLYQLFLAIMFHMSFSIVLLENSNSIFAQKHNHCFVICCIIYCVTNAESSLLMTLYLFTYLKVSVLFLGELSEEEEVLQWLITQKTEERIELITRVMLERLVDEIQYLAVYFCKYIVQKDIPVHADLLYLKNVCQIIDKSCF